MNLTVLLIITGILNLIECFIIFRKKKPDGQIRIDLEDPMKDTYTLELFIPLGELNNRTNVNLMITKEGK